MTDTDTTTPPTDADQPDAQAGDPQPANADENRPPAGEASDADTPRGVSSQTRPAADRAGHDPRTRRGRPL